MKMPDVSWVSKQGWNGLSTSDKEKFIHCCPEFVVEIKSKTDRLKDIQSKMESWIKNGAHLAWLIDPQDEKVWVYRKNGTQEEITGFDNSLKGEDVLQGFVFHLTDLRIE